MLRPFALNLMLCVAFVAEATPPPPAAGEQLDRWDGTIAFGALKLPFTMQLQIQGGTVQANFTNLGDPAANDRAAARGTLINDVLRIPFDADTSIEARVDGGSFKGTYQTKTGKYSMEAGKFCTCGFAGEAGPDISGSWNLSDGRKMRIERKGEDTMAVVEGVPVTVAGRFDGAVFTLSYFDGDPARGVWLEMEPSKDGRNLAVVMQTPATKPQRLSATRP